MSGRLPSKIAAYDNASEFPSIVPTFAHYLRRSGYRTVLCGKMHFVGADQLHGFEERLTTDVYPADFAWTPDWRHPDDRIAWWYHNLLPSSRPASPRSATNWPTTTRWRRGHGFASTTPRAAMSGRG